MVLIKLGIIVIMFSGLLCTLAPRLYGTVIILVAGLLHSLFLGANKLEGWMIALLLLTVMGEFGAAALRVFLTRKNKLSRIYSVDTSVCNLAGIIISSAFFGSLIGTTLWGLLVSKDLLPNLDNIRKNLTKLILTALVRFTCGLIMTGMIIAYTM